jgi:hypothetical protein
MTGPVIASADAPTPEFRWFDVGGTQNVLQQKWVVTSASTSKGSPESRHEEWRNVPVVKKERV